MAAESAERLAPSTLAFLGLVVALALGVAGCGGDGDEAPPQPKPPEQPAGGEQAAGGEQVFIEQGCGSCHVLAAAGTSGQTGPNLDEVLPGADEAFIRQSIVDPNAEIEEGFQPGVMPDDFGEKLSGRQLDQLVAFLSESAGG